jgi:hypothetical protein
MTRLSVVAALLVTFAIGMGPAWAEDPAPAQTPPPAASSGSSSKMTSSEKKAISKSCSDQANAKNLHGEARKKFRAACKSHGGKAPE